MSEQAKKLLIPVLNQDDENPPPVQQTETDLSVSKGEDNEEGGNVAGNNFKDTYSRKS